MRILNVSSLYTPYAVGGAEQGLQAVAEALAEAGDEVHVATLTPPSTNKNDRERLNGVQVHRVPLRNVYWPWRETRPQSLLPKSIWHSIDTHNLSMRSTLVRLVRKISPTIVVTGNLQGWSTAVVPAIQALGVPVVHVINDYALVCPQTTLYRNGRACGTLNDRCRSCRLLTLPRQKHMRHVDGVIGVSRSVLDFHRAHGYFRDNPATVIHNALKPGFDIVDKLRPTNSKSMVFGFLGRVEPLKGIENLLSAAELLERENFRFNIEVAGKPNDPGYLKELQQRWPSSKVRYRGSVDAAAFLDTIDCLVVPSLWLEALGNVAFEAFARGVPVIGAETGGIPETIDHGVNGLIYAQDDPLALAQCMQLVIEDIPARHQFAQAALEKAAEYSAPNRARAYHEFLQMVLTNRQARKSA
ncbi:MAG: glycosyltransferase family 4 protein [Pseudomonadota bacterium]